MIKQIFTKVNMEKIYQTSYVTATWDGDLKLLKTVWVTPPVMDEMLYRNEVIQYFSSVDEKSPDFVLINAQNAEYNVLPETQVWMVENHFPVYVKTQLKKMAVIVSKDFITQLSLEQTIQEAKESPFETAYFDEEQKAMEWFAN